MKLDHALTAHNLPVSIMGSPSPPQNPYMLVSTAMFSSTNEAEIPVRTGYLNLLRTGNVRLHRIPTVRAHHKFSIKCGRSRAVLVLALVLSLLGSNEAQVPGSSST